jgi:hypothetical protein
VTRELKSLSDADPPMLILNARDGVRVRGMRLGLFLMLVALPQLACGPRPVSSQAAPATPAPAPSPPEAAAKEIRLADSSVRDEALTYEGYTVRKRHKMVREDGVPEGRAEVAYAVLERKGKVVRSFDAGVYNGGLNSIDFGLFPFLGGPAKQFFISQDAPRTGQQWIVSLSPSPRVIYDGPAFAAGRELDDMSVADLDGDGVYEVVAPLCQFYGFRDWALAPADTPLPLAVFKYDAQAGEYLPANRLFRAHLLKEVDAAKAKVRDPSAGASHLADVLSIVLSYVFAGDERAAWEFYEAAYRLPDKAEVKREVVAVLRSQPVYRFMYRKAAGR